MAKSVPKLSLPQIHPDIGKTINLNCCGDPDCRNYGVAPDFIHQSFVGRNAQTRKQNAFAANPALAKGYGKYTITGGKDLQVVSTALEHSKDPHLN